MGHIIREKKKLQARVRRIKGQADAIERALDQEADCAVVLQQIAAIRGAINGLMSEVLEGHLREHVTVHASSKEGQRDIETVVRVLRSYLK